MEKYKTKSYELATLIQSLQPWNFFTDTDPIYVHMLDDTDIYIDIMGAAGKIYGITFFEGESGLGDMLEMANSSNNTDADNYYLMCDMSNITLYFDDIKDIINPSFIDCIEKDYSNLKGKIPYFVRYKRGNFPIKPNRNEFKKLDTYLEILKLIILKVKEEGFSQRDDEILAVYLDDDYKDEGIDGLVFTSLPYPQMSMRYFNLPYDAKRAKKLKKKKESNDFLIIDGKYMSPQIADEYKNPIFPYIVLLIAGSGELRDIRFILPDEDRVSVFQDMILNNIEQFGIPETIAVRREEIEASIAPIADDLDFEFSDIDWNLLDEEFDKIEQFASMDDSDNYQ